MQLTKLAHACVRLAKDGAVLVTHEHFDHVEPDTLRAALTASPGLRVWAAAPVAGQFADFGDRVRAVAHGDDFTAAGFAVHVYGEQHATIHPDIPTVANVGFMIDGEVFHPGDSYTVPEDPVAALLAPISGPWYSTREMIDYVRAVAPQRTYAIHDALLSPIGLQVAEMFSGLAAGPNNASYTRLEPGTTVEL